MAQVRLRLDGFQATQRALQRAPQVVQKYAAGAVFSSAIRVAERARAMVPVDTGTLKRNIGWDWTLNSLTAGVGITNNEAFYWRFVEFGTKHVAARPFFRPAAEESRAYFIQQIRDIGPDVERELAE